MTVELSAWDASEYLETPEDIVAYLNAALEDGNSALLQAALGDIARSKGMSKIARSACVGRESLYKSLSENGNPSLATIIKVLKALDMKLEVSLVREQENPAA